MTTLNSQFLQAIQAFEATQNILILPSQPADGDSIGSALALFQVLKAKGKNVSVVLTAELPEIFKFMPGSDSILPNASVYSDFVITIDLKNQSASNVKHEIVDNKINIIVTPEHGTLLPEQVSFPTPQKKYDLLVILDAASPTQLGEFYKQNYLIFGEIPSINIDHHVSNTNFASMNLVDKNASSTTQILFDLFKAYKIEITADIATLLLTGLITDTGSFQNDNTTPEAFDLAAELIEAGGRQQEIIKNIYKTKQLQTLKLWGKILSNIKVDETNRIVWATASRMDFSETGTTEKDTGDIIDELISNAEEADTVLLLIENSDGSLHVSIRTTTDEKDATKLAAQFGGGGHPRAAGFTLENASIASHESVIIQSVISQSGPNTEPTVEVISQGAVKEPQATILPEAPAQITPEAPAQITADDDQKRIEKMAINFVSGQPVSEATVTPENSVIQNSEDQSKI